MSGPELITLGCRLNIAESEAMRALNAGRDDLIIVNSCAVTAEAVRETRKAIRRAHRLRPDARILVTGCAAQIDPASFAAMPEVTSVIANNAKTEPRSFGLNHAPSRAPLPTQTRAFVEVQNGCDHACTFCIIPQGRGPSRSTPPAQVIRTIETLVATGHREIVLTGVDLTSYGPDLPNTPTLGHLIEAILAAVPALERLRISSLDSAELDDRLFDLITGEHRIMPHLHLSLQAGDDLILKRMKRRHSRADAVATVARLKARRPDIAIGADLIAGFPTETDAQAANTRALIADCDVVHAHIFPYSPRETTPAARMPQLDRATIKARAASLRATAATHRAAWLATLAGTTQSVLLERSGTHGHAPNFAPVRLSPSPPKRHPSEGWDLREAGPNVRTGASRDASLRWHDGR